jgi:drug/metabolite transporter (DMT)-like permease
LPNRKKTALGILIAVAVAIGYGLGPVCARAAYADGANAGYAMVVITLLRTLPLWLFCIVKGKPLFATRRDTMTAVKSGFFQTGSSVTNIIALVTLPAAIAGTIAYTHTLMLLFFLAWKGKVRLNAGNVLSTIAALFGLTLVVDVWNVHSKVDPVGIAFSLASAVAIMSRMYVFDHQTKTRNPAVVGAETFLCTSVLVLLLTLLMKPQMPHTLAGHGWMLLCGTVTGVSTFGLFYGISLIGAFRFSLLMKMEPIFTALFSFLLIGETLYGRQYLGMGFVVGSLAIYQYAEHRKKEKAV